LPSGNYRVGFTGLPNGYGFTQPNLGNDDATDSDAGIDEENYGLSQVVTIDNSVPDDESLLRVNPTIDAGIVPVGSIGDYVWFDTIQNGQQDPGEEGVNGVTVELYHLVQGEGGVYTPMQIATTVTKNNPNDTSK